MHEKVTEKRSDASEYDEYEVDIVVDGLEELAKRLGCALL